MDTTQKFISNSVIKAQHEADKAKGFKGDYSGINEYDNTIDKVVRYYYNAEQRIIEYSERCLTRYYDAYPFDWMPLFTPIEMDAWGIIRSVGKIVLYPQYPVLQYRADFANPYLKIILECDGKEWHDPERDKKRDKDLLKSGWKVFRVTGSELYRITKLQTKYDSPDDYDYDEDEPYTFNSLYDYYLTSAEGVIHALRAYYFTKTYDPQTQEGRLQLETLEEHRLVQFEL